jgi:hypothetical protein
MNRSGYSFIYFLLFLFAVSIVITPVVNAEWVIDKTGKLTYYNSEVLGDKSGRVLPSKTETSKEKSEISGFDDMGDLCLDSDLFSSFDTVEAEFKQEDLKTSELEKAETLKVEPKDGRLGVKDASDEGSKKAVELDEATLKVEDRMGNERVRIASGSGSSLILYKGTKGAQTSLPLSINTSTNELTVTTPAGAKTVGVLPEEAIDRLKKNKVVDFVSGTKDASASAEGLKDVDSIFNLDEQSGKLVYHMKGTKNKKLLWLFDVSIQKTVEISAENGDVVKVAVDSSDSWKDWLSF